MADLEGINGQRTEFKVVGKPNLPGKLSYAIATGKAKFGIDYVFDNMLHAKFLHSPYANAMVKSVDVAAAKMIPGVVDILTWEDEDLKNFGRRGGGGMMGFGGPSGPYVSNTANMEDEEVGVIVVAETEELCDEALKALNPQWEVRPHIVDILEGRKPDAPLIRPNTGGGGGFGMMGGGAKNPPPKGNVSYFNANRGDVEAGFKEADQIVEYDFNMPAFSGHIPNPSGAGA
jgi:CO/xanthine dehydrogenase Mo-binding subunit